MISSERFASIYVGHGKVFAVPLSGARGRAIDLEAGVFSCPLDAPPDVLGSAVMNALGASRQLPPEALKRFFAPAAIAGRYEQFVAEMQRQSDVGGVEALFREMRLCHADQNEERVLVRPTRHEELDGWSGDGISPEDIVRTEPGPSPEALGKAVLLAISRCK